MNFITGTRAAVVHETSGTTRDRKELVCEWAGKRFLLIDTGGVDIASADAIVRSIAAQARLAVAQADLVLLVTDARAGVTPGDEELAAYGWPQVTTRLRVTLCEGVDVLEGGQGRTTEEHRPGPHAHHS